VTGDHSTPARMKTHSWHPVPTLIWGQNVRTDQTKEFNERSCLQGGLGQFEAKHLLTLALAHAGRLAKYGA
jgi:2,3-bisphosphoglycerate-independent phosphoglycerate mutase